MDQGESRNERRQREIPRRRDPGAARPVFTEARRPRRACRGAHSYTAYPLTTSLPLDGGRRLGRDVVRDAVDAPHLVDDPVRGARQHVVRDVRPVGRHAVGAGDGAEADGLLVRPKVAHHAHRLHGQQHGEGLPNVAVLARRAELVEPERVRAAEQIEALRSHGAKVAHGQPGPGERVPPDDALGHAERAARLPHLVLEQLAERLEQLEAQLLGQPADVVVRLDRRRGPAERDRLDHVRVERPLGEKARLAPQALRHGDGLLLEHLDERPPDDRALLLGVGHAGEALEEERPGVDCHEVDLESVAERPLDLLELARPQQSVVDEDARELVPDGLRDERGRDRRVDAARQAEDDVVVADERADLGRLVVDERARRPVAAAAADAEHEVG